MGKRYQGSRCIIICVRNTFCHYWACGSGSWGNVLVIIVVVEPVPPCGVDEDCTLLHQKLPESSGLKSRNVLLWQGPNRHIYSGRSPVESTGNQHIPAESAESVRTFSAEEVHWTLAESSGITRLQRNNRTPAESNGITRLWRNPAESSGLQQSLFIASLFNY